MLRRSISEAQERHVAALQMQSYWRGHQGRKEFATRAEVQRAAVERAREEAAGKIRAVWRGKQGRQAFADEYDRKTAAVLAMQKEYRRHVVACEVERMKAARNAATMVQKSYRGYRGRKEMAEMKAAVEWELLEER